MYCAFKAASRYAVVEDIAAKSRNTQRQVSGARLCSLLLSAVALTVLHAQPSFSQAPQSERSLAQIQAAAAGQETFKAIRLHGKLTSGNDQEGAPVTIVVRADGATRIDLNVVGGTRTEEQMAAGAIKPCLDHGSDGHGGRRDDCLSAASWILPTIALASAESIPNLKMLLNANVSNDGSLVLQAYIEPPQSSEGVKKYFRSRSQRTIYLNPATLLPNKLTFNSYGIPAQSQAGHPGQPAVPVEMTYSNYRTVSGVTVPFLVQRKTSGLVVAIAVNEVEVER